MDAAVQSLVLSESALDDLAQALLERLRAKAQECGVSPETFVSYLLLGCIEWKDQ